jgi:hypothetical protein
MTLLVFYIRRIIDRPIPQFTVKQRANVKTRASTISFAPSRLNISGFMFLKI